MKNILYSTIACILVLSLPLCLSAQQDSLGKKEIKTLLKGGKGEKGGYATLWAGYSSINGHDGFSYGLNAAVLLGHSFGIGVAGSGFSNEYFFDHPSGANYQSLQGGYGGLLLEPVIFPRFPVHVSFPVVIGIGAVAQMDAYYWGSFDYEYYYRDADLFFVAEPGIDLEVNLVKHLRLAVGAKYRITSPTQLPSFANDALNGFSVNLAMKFGKF